MGAAHVWCGSLLLAVARPDPFSKADLGAKLSVTRAIAFGTEP